MAKLKAFAAYPGEPNQIGQTIDVAIEELQQRGSDVEITSWRHIDKAGHFIVDGVLDQIDASEVVLVDITKLNFNVTFEAGYAIGRGKRLTPTINSALQPQKKEISELGVFDTLGYETYENAGQLQSLLTELADNRPLNISVPELNRSAPIYVLDTFFKTDTALRILSRIKKARIGFRSFDPKEQSRLSATEAYRNVASSVAVVVNLLSSNSTDHVLNNLRGAFIAGLAYGLRKDCLVLQEGEEPVPVDYRDFVTVYRQPSDIDAAIGELAPKVMEGVQAAAGITPVRALGLLERLDLGAPAAENEMTTLSSYYVETDEYNKTVAGGVRLAVGRKGSGKTALFFQVRDRLRRNRGTVILDLKPDGHQLKRFKEMVLNLVSEAVKEHISKAFWEYLLLLEIAYRLLQNDRQRHTTDHTLFGAYHALAAAYEKQYRKGEGDFSERMWELVQRISQQFAEKYGGETKYLTAAEVTALVYKHEIPRLYKALLEYLQLKGDVWVLFDNIDKGWPTHGVGEADILVLRSLLDATRHIEQSFARQDAAVRTVVFVRNDVYELLVEESPDRGKESRVVLDWTDPDLLREFLRRRIVHNDDFHDSDEFNAVWARICVSHVSGEESAQYLINRSLMRPRNLLNLANYAKSSAVNLQHAQITVEDIDKACLSYSADMVNEVGLEIRDVFPEAVDLLYYFIGAGQWLNRQQLFEVLGKSTIPESKWAHVIELLLWFAFLGIVREKNEEIEEQYIFGVNYDMKKLRRLANDFNDDAIEYSIHPAFWPFLDIKGKA